MRRNTLIKTAFLCLTVFLFASPALAKSKTKSCYTLPEAEAEQGIRIHSELMIIGLNCQHLTPAGQKNYYQQYNDFTLKNQDLLARYETILIDHFKNRGDKNPERSLHDMRTLFANKIAGDAAKMRPDIFCHRYTQRLVQADNMNNDQVRRWASTFFPSHPVSEPLCAPAQ